MTIPPPLPGQQRPLARARRLVPLLAALVTASAPGAQLTAEETPQVNPPRQPPAASPEEGWRLIAPSPSLSAQGIIHVGEGFVLSNRDDGTMVAGQALRWDQQRSIMYAQGNVVLTLPATAMAQHENAQAQEAAAERQAQIRQLEQQAALDNGQLRTVEGLIERPHTNSSDGPNTLTSIRLEAERLGLRRLEGPLDEQGRLLDDEGAVVGRWPYRGQASNARIWVRMADLSDEGPSEIKRDERLARFQAETVQILPDRLILEYVRVVGGYGRLFEFRARRLVIGLRHQVAEDRRGFERQVADITLWGPQLRFIELPVFWLPVVYRDFRLDYPWTRYEFGRSRRLGNFIRGWTGSKLPSIQTGSIVVPTQNDGPLTPAQREAQRELLARHGQDFSEAEANLGVLYKEEPILLESRLQGRVDHHTRAGTGYGAQLSWLHPQAGEGEAQWYAMPHEKVFLPRSFQRALVGGPVTRGRLLGAQFFAGGADGNQRSPPIINRHAKVIDAEHFFSQGALSAYGRYVEIPDADPLVRDILDPLDLQRPPERRAPRERFRSDFLTDELETRPAARQGVAAAYSSPWLSTVVDSEFKHHPYLDETEREIGVQLTAPPMQILGPLHLDADGWAEKLRREQPAQRRVDNTWRESSGERYTYDGALEASHWLGGLGIDARAGARGAWERDGRLERWRRTDQVDPRFAAFGAFYDTSQFLLLDLDDLGTARQTSAISVDSQSRWQPYFEGGISLRLQREWGNDEISYRHIFTPRVGVEINLEQRGTPADEWIDLQFGGERSTLPSDQRLLTLGFNTSIVRDDSRSILSADVTTRWSWRDADRSYRRELTDDERDLQAFTNDFINGLAADIRAPAITTANQFPNPGRNLFLREYNRRYVDPLVNELQPDTTLVRSGSPLVEATARISLNPSPTFSLGGNATYDFVRDEVADLALRTSWLPHRRVQLTWQTVWLPETISVDQERVTEAALINAINPAIDIDTRVRREQDWQHQAAVRLVGNRYTFDGQFTLRPGGNPVDILNLAITRQFVDGEIGLTADLLWDEDGRSSDRSIGISFSLFGFNLRE